MFAKLAKLKSQLYLILGIVLGYAALIARNLMLKGQRNRARENERQEKARADQNEKIIESDTELNNTFSELDREARKDVAEGKMPANIRNRNDW